MQICGELPGFHIKFQMANIPLGQGQGGTQKRGIRAVVQPVFSDIEFVVLRPLKSSI